MTYVELSHVSFAHASGPMSISNCSLRLERGITAIVGANGAGKSTLLRLVAGELRPDTGHVRVCPRDAVMRTVPQDVEALPPEVLAFADRMDREAQRLRGELELDALGLERWSTLSPGERRRFQLAAAWCDAPDVLLLDEPSNHLDAHTRTLLLGLLRGFRGVGLLVSHDRELIDALAVRTVRLHGGEAHAYEGGYTAARRAWEIERAARFETRERLRQDAEAASRRLADARRTQASAERARSSRVRMRSVHDSDARSVGAKTLAMWAEARASRAVTVLRRDAERARERLDEARVEKPLGRSIHASHQPCPRRQLAVLESRSLVCGDSVVLRDVSLVLERDARVLVEGPNGAGKSTLLVGLRQAIAETERVLHLPQELTDGEARALLSATRAMPRGERGRVLHVLAALGVDPDVLLASERPSLGEARKLAMAHGLGRGAWALLLDEPQNHLDLPSVERLEAALLDFPGALVVVSHDPRFAAGAFHETWRVDGGRVHRESALHRGSG